MGFDFSILASPFATYVAFDRLHILFGPEFSFLGGVRVPQFSYLQKEDSKTFHFIGMLRILKVCNLWPNSSIIP